MNIAKPRQLVVIAGQDAYLKGAHNICALLAKQGPIEVQWFTTSPQLVSAKVRWLNFEHLSDDRYRQHYPWLDQAQQIIAGLGGRDLNRLIKVVHSAQHQAATRPLIVGYFPGILHLRIFESLATRLLCDRVLLNCSRDYRLYRRLALATLGYNNGQLLGAPWIGPSPHPDHTIDIDLLFVEQSIVPFSLAQRTRLVELLISLARQHPNWRIVIAIRARKGEASSHELGHCLEDIWQTLDNGDVQLEFVLDDIDDLLRRSRRVATISSSAAFTSIAWCKPTLFISDLGVDQDWGNDLLARSGYMAPILEAGQQVFSFHRWGRQFIQQPSLDAIARLYNLKRPEAGSYTRTVQAGIPGIHAFNLRLLWQILLFYLRNKKSPLIELCSLFRSIKNINLSIYRTSTLRIFIQKRE